MGVVLVVEHMQRLLHILVDMQAEHKLVLLNRLAALHRLEQVAQYIEVD